MRPSLAQKAFAAAGLSLLFIVVYGGCNWFAAQRHVMRTVNFEWERQIPFVPLMIAPYMSLDLFFIGAPFLCRSRDELASFSKRIASAILIGGAFFLTLPFRFAFARPEAAGWLGAIFNHFRALDAPYNLVPSLHITLCTLLAIKYAQHSRGLVRMALTTWFALIATSALLTWQHHVLDVLSGFALAVLCLTLFPEGSARHEIQRTDPALLRTL